MVSMSKCNLPHPKQPRLCDEVHQVILPQLRRTEVGRVSVTGALLGRGWGGVRMRPIRPSAYGLWPTSQGAILRGGKLL